LSGRTVRTWLALLSPVALAACASYVPPSPLPPEPVARDLPASYDRARAAASGVASAGAFAAEAVQPPQGTLTLGFRIGDAAPFVDCGDMVDRWTGRTTPALLGLGFDAASLAGTANISVKPAGANQASVAVSGQYALDVYRIDPVGMRVRITEFRFGSLSSDTRRVGLLVLTCRSSERIERALVDDIAARL